MKNLAGKVSHLLIAGILVTAGCGGGDKGDPGAKGDNGADGTDGTNGNNGTNGTNGATGDAGVPGKTGANGTDGTDGADGDAGVSTAPLSVNITNSLSPTDAPVAAAKVTLSPAVGIALNVDATTGKGSATLPIGTYTLSIAATGYTTATQTVTLLAGVPATVAVKLVPAAKVAVNAGADLTAQAPGTTITLSGVTATPLDGSTITTYAWTQPEGPTATLANATQATPSVTLPDAAAIKAALVKALAQPVRLGVVGINPHAIELATTVVLSLKVTTSSGSYTDTVNIGTTAPFQVTTSLRNVPVGVPQLLQAAALPTGVTAYAWTVAGPAGSTATLTEPTTQYPVITPDVAGTYTLTEASTSGSIALVAGTWVGAISGLNAGDGLPDAASCTGCHSATGIAKNANNFPDWRVSGHAQIFSQNINDPANHWTQTGCASCHTVGYNTLATANNGGFDDAAKTAAWVQPAGAANAYASMFANATTKPVAQLANVQCENCHGPNGSDAHMSAAPASASSRVSLAAEVCGSCHGEPLRHGRYQQWQESGHGNSQLAMDRGSVEGSSGVMPTDLTATNNNANHCGRCHSAEGFVVWQEQSQSPARAGDFNKKIQGAAGDATVAELVAMGMTRANVHSQTCTACHDPHKQGQLSGEPNTANVRIMDNVNMLPAGFPAIGMGKGALCATCHNGRNGAHNDSVTTYGSTGIATPHDSTAAEVVLGQNVYFVAQGQRGGHSYITNTCTNCHMELSPPPEEFSYQLTGTNHAFEADIKICTNCHGAFDGGSIKAVTKVSLSNLATFIGTQGGKAFNGKVFWTRARRIPASTTDTTAVYSHAASTGTDLSAYNVKVDLTTNSVVSGFLMENSSNLQIKLATPIQIQWTDGTAPVDVSEFIISLTSVRSDDTSVTPSAPINTYPVSLTGNLAKAIWNYVTLYREGSFGIHNPSFTNQVISATMSQNLSL